MFRPYPGLKYILDDRQNDLELTFGRSVFGAEKAQRRRRQFEPSLLFDELRHFGQTGSVGGGGEWLEGLGGGERGRAGPQHSGAGRERDRSHVVVGGHPVTMVTQGFSRRDAC